MKSIVRLIRSLAILAVFAFSGPAAHAQIPVTDALGLAQSIQQVAYLTQQLTQMEKDYQMLTSQYTTMTAQYAAITGNHSYGTILNDSSLHDYMPDSWSSIYSNISSGSNATLGSSATSILQTEGLTSGSTDSQTRYYNTLAANKAMQMAAYNANISRLDNIQSLMEQANATDDASAKADLQNRLAAEQAMVQNEQTRLNMMKSLQDSELKLAQQQQETETKTLIKGN
ncbi:P-type DNA transfer protein VirB5 [Paraburkholderia sp. EG285A]|uniref:P-type DNA transfer protein VirB5 n=1 Tax=Paraburkholderia sp. EG285A TaxID=3237009 RepID=UPI0034D2539C